MADEQAAPLWYFAYGSNLHRDVFIGRRQMQPLDVHWGWLAGYRLCFNIPVGPGERGVANIAPDPAQQICGALYLLTTADCERLDNSEGVGVGLYRRTPVGIVTGTGKRVGGFTYQSSVIAEGRKPSPRYMGLVLEGARQHGLPAEWIASLHTFPLAVDERAAGGQPGSAASSRS